MNEIEERIYKKTNDKKKSCIMPFPKNNFLLEVTNNCNNSCIFCANRLMSRKRGFINQKLAYRLIEEAFDLGMREIGFYATGEPLLNNKLEDYIKHAKKIGYNYIYITTNGILANINKVKALYQAGLNSIKFSINASDKETYELIHGTNNFNKVIKNLNEIKKWRDSNQIKLKIFVSYVATKNSYSSIKEIKKYFNFFCDSVIVLPVINQGGLLPRNMELTVDEIPSDKSINVSCPYPFNSIIVTYEGYLTACCMDFQNYLVYADLNKDTLKDSWNNHYILELRKKHLKKDVSCTLCDNCLFNSKRKPQPLIKEYASLFNYNDFQNDNELETRKRKKQEKVQ